MAVLETEALVLRTYNFGEADKIVVCLTHSSGLIRAVAKGCRKLKSRFGASLEPFTLVKIAYYQKEHQDLVSLNHTEIVKSHFDLSGQAETLTGLAYMGDLVIEFSPPYEANEKLYRMVKACLDAICESQADLQVILRYFEIWLLKLEGFLPDLRRCGECHRAFDQQEPTFLSADLVFRCRDCSRGAGRVVSTKLQTQLRATQKLAPFVFAQESRAIPESIHREMAELTHRLIGRVLERQPRLKSTFQ
ncbi:MAG TPA: DNA repair protein RecO [Pyrinomonadaceae bacterium]|jgi:DNA repair protein RecO (recombination protein O)|nr:DNA repair protein RecO [Pyrinomonadaceae bacterium]